MAGLRVSSMLDHHASLFPSYRRMTISRAEVIERAKVIAVVAARNASEAESLRRMPEENVQAIMQSGLMPLLRPREFGGFESDWLTHIDCVAEVARCCGSTGWCMSFLIQHQFYLAYFPLATQKFVYERSPDPKIVTSFAPTGKARKVKGGFELSGRWVFASGVDHCDWAIVGGRVETDRGKAVGNFLLTPGQFRVDRVWNSVGLRGTGSNDLLVDEPIFVSEEFFYSQADALNGVAPGSLALAGRLYRGPLAMNSGFGVMTAMHGIAQGALEAFVSNTSGKVALMGTKNAAEFNDIQTAVGQSKGEIDLAHLLVAKMSALAVVDRPISIDDIVETRRDLIFLMKLLRGAVDRLFSFSGARGLDQGQALQRHWRDIHAISHHFTFAMPSLQTEGRRALGLGPADGDLIESFEWVERPDATRCASESTSVASLQRAGS